MSRQAASPHYHKTLDNKYMLGDEIGKGAYGRVYKALDLANGDFVAVKQVSLNNIDQEDLNSIMQEIDLLKNLNHINIVKYLGSVKTKSDLHIVLEFVENGSLADIIKPNKFGPFPESLVAVYIAQVLEGLVYLHEQGVIHRDIKGANILTTKEGLVKLADFGVATKLTEADTTSHSVVGTPYWMAPEVILLSGVCAASDIWSVGCTVIELLTCIPPYYDLVPMTALFKIVQDEHPPIPESLSPNITDFLCQCFKKDARHRPDAKTLLSHPWIQNYRRELQSSIRQSRTLRDVQADVSMGEKLSNADIRSSDLSSAEETEEATSSIKADFRKELLSNAVSDGRKYREDPASDVNSTEENTDGLENDMKDQAPSLGIHEKSEAADLDDQAHMANDEPPSNGEVKSPALVTKSVTKHGKRNSIGFRSSGFGARNQGGFPEKASKVSVIMGGNDLSKFSDTPGDASLDDLFHPLDKHPDHRATEASTSPSISQANQGNTMVNNAGKCDLATKLRATIAQKQMESGMDQANGSGGKLYQLMMGVLRDEVIDTGGLVFDENFSGENLFPLQAVEFSRLVGSLKIDESEDVVVSSCKKLIAMFHQHPEQKVVFVTQHGFLPLMELLEVLKTRVICSVLQIINQIIKDNTDFQENACHVGLIPVVMSFAVPSHSREIRMEAAYFLQQLCQSSSLTLQMFIACRGIPVLVGFLEADYAKFREMVHLAIDGMWQVFKLQQSTLRNDFCRIAAKNGILLRLINTLYSLNEATHLASISDGGAIPLEGPAHRPRSGLLDPGHPTFAQSDGPLSEYNDHSKTRHGVNDSNLSNGAVEPARASTSNSHLEANHSDPRYLHQEADRPRSSNAVVDDLVTSKLHESTSTVKVVNMSSKDTSTTSQGDLDLRKQHDHLYLHISATDRHPKMVEGTSNGLSATAYTQHEQVRPLLSLLDKEPPSRHVSGQLEYVHQLPMLERHESRLPFIQASNEKKTNGELDFIMAEFADVSQQGSEKGNLDSTTRIPPKTVNKGMGILASNKISASISGVASQTASGVLSRSGVLNARPGSATSSGVLSHMVSTLNADVAKGYLEKVSDLLLEFARAETIVKSFMCSQSLLCRLFQMFNRVEPPILLKILKCVNHLSTDPNCLENLQRADAIKYLTPNLELKEGSLVPQIHHEVLNALFNLCKINKRRQEQAAANGIIPHLMHFIESNSPLKQYALPLLCDMAHASRNSREQVRAHGGLDVYLSLLEDELWSVTALDSIAVCLAHDNDNQKVEQALLKKDAVQKLVKFFQCCPEQYFVHILEPFLKIITRSSRINTALAVNGLTPLLITRLDHQDAIARLNLLKLIKAVYEHHPQPKQLIVENNLPQKLQNLIEERSGQSSGGQVLVKQMATSLLKALHINTVL